MAKNTRKKTVKQPIVIRVTISGPQAAGKTVLAALIESSLSWYCSDVISENYEKISDQKLADIFKGKRIVIETTNI